MSVETLSLDDLRERYVQLQSQIQERLHEFTQVPAGVYFYELAYCLLTPQSSAVNAGKAIAELQANDFRHKDFDPVGLLHRKEYYIRFHHTKAKRLVAMKKNYSDIEAVLLSGKSGQELREWLVEHIKGLGWKEASHFLRNIGYRNLAILDRHILKNLLKCGVLEQIPKTLSTKEYFRIEQLFFDFSTRINIPMDELDLLFWSMETGEILK